MSISRLIVIDPAPRDPANDLIVYQLPERSRARELLIELLDREGIEWVEIEGKPRSKKPIIKGPFIGDDSAELEV